MVFLDFNLPNATTWFYLSLMLAVGLFFKFNRFFSLRNWDLLSLYLLVPGFLFLQEAYKIEAPPNTFGNPEARSLVRWGFIWLMAGSACYFLRCMLDMTLVSRPSLIPNANLAGLAWFAGAMFVCMVPVAIRTTEFETVGKKSAALDVLDKAGTQTVDQMRQIAGDSSLGDNPTHFWVKRTTSLLGHLAVVAALVLIGAVHFQNTTTGMAAGTFYLLLPYTGYYVGQAHHVLPAALLVWAVYGYRRPWLAGLLLGLASGMFFFPVLTVPIWLSYYRRNGSRRFMCWFAGAAGASLGLTAIVLWWDGSLARALQLALSVSDWQPWRPTNLVSIWHGVHGAYRLPICVLHLALVTLTGFWPSPKNLGHVIALSAAVLIGMQFWLADQGGVYVLWYLPLLVLLIARPNLSDRFPPSLPANPPWLSRQVSRLLVWAARRIQPPEPAQTV